MHWMLIKNGERTMIIWLVVTELLHLKIFKRCWHKHFSWTLHCSNSVRMYQIIIVLWPFFDQHSMHCRTMLADFWLNFFNFYLIWATRIQRIWVISASDLMAYISEATRNWHTQHLFSDWKCNIASFKRKNNFLTRGCNRSSKKSIWLPDYSSDLIFSN